MSQIDDAWAQVLPLLPCLASKVPKALRDHLAELERRGLLTYYASSGGWAVRKVTTDPLSPGVTTSRPSG